MSKNQYPPRVGDYAVWQRPDRSSISVKIIESNPAEIRVLWASGGPQGAIPSTAWIPASRWNELTLFPAGCKFMVV